MLVATAADNRVTAHQGERRDELLNLHGD